MIRSGVYKIEDTHFCMNSHRCYVLPPPDCLHGPQNISAATPLSGELATKKHLDNGIAAKVRRGHMNC